MTESKEPRGTRPWRVAVWGLRTMVPGLVVVATGLVALASGLGWGPTLLAVGIVIYVAGMVMAVIGIGVLYLGTSTSRPNFIWLRWALMFDASHARSSRETVTVPDVLAARGAGPLSWEELVDGLPWRRAVWSLRATGVGLLLVVAGLITLAWSPSAGVLLAILGAAWNVACASVSIIEVHRCQSGALDPPAGYARVRQRLVHDAWHVKSQ